LKRGLSFEGKKETNFFKKTKKKKQKKGKVKSFQLLFPLQLKSFSSSK